MCAEIIGPGTQEGAGVRQVDLRIREGLKRDGLVNLSPPDSLALLPAAASGIWKSLRGGIGGGWTGVWAER
jgi:hypothetical protein